MGFIFLESDLNVLKALNKNWLGKGNEEDVLCGTHSVWLTCVFPSWWNLDF